MALKIGAAASSCCYFCLFVCLYLLAHKDINRYTVNHKIDYELVEIGDKVVIVTVIRCSSPEPNATNNNEILLVFETIDLIEISIFNILLMSTVYIW